jgi:ribokinase
MQVSRPRVAVVGHVEWVQFARVPHVPRAGEVVHAHDAFEEPAGGGGVAAVQLARLAGEATLLTALGDDRLGDRSAERLGELGVHVCAARRAEVTRRASTLVDGAGERTIVTLGPRLEPKGNDAEPAWVQLGEMDAVYFTAGDVDALRAARAARVLVATPRAGEALGQGVALDALVLSGEDAIERRMATRAQVQAELVVFTEGSRGGAYRERSGGSGTWTAAQLPGAPVDAYGCGDSFAAAFTFGVGRGDSIADAAHLGAQAGALALTRTGAP